MKSLQLRFLVWAVVFVAALGARAVEESKAVALDPAKGAISSESVFTVSFPGEMIGVASIDVGGLECPLVTVPTVKTQFLWKSPTEGEYTIKGPIRPGTHFKISTISGLKDLQGKAVASGAWEFDSDPFEIRLEDDERERLSSQPRISLSANYPVSLSDAASHVFFQDRDSHERFATDVVVEPGQSPDRATSFTVTPRKRLTMGRTFDVIVDGISDAFASTPLTYLHVFAAGETQPLEVQWVGAFNDANADTLIRCKLDEQIDPDSVSAKTILITPEVPGLKLHAAQDEVIAEGEFKLGQRYTVRITPELRGIRGFGLAAESKWGATIRPKPSTIVFPSGSVAERSAAGLKFAFLQVNTGPVSWRLFSVPLALLPQVADRVREYKDGEPPLDLTLAAEGHFDANTDAESVLREINLRPAKPLSGPYLLEVSGPGADGKVVANRTLAYFSEYIVTQKRSEAKVSVRVARMGDDTPVADVQVKVITKENVELASSQTGKDGIAQFERDDLFPERKSGGTWFVISAPEGPVVREVEGTKLIAADYRADDGESGLRSLLVTDRNLYRPGQTVKMHGILRNSQQGELTVPPAESLSWKISPSEGEEVGSGDAKVTRAGAWDAEWVIPSEIPLGEYRILFSIGDKDQVLETIRIEEYRVPLFVVDVEKIEEPGAVSQVKVASTYFHGAPNAGARVHWKATWMTLQGESDDKFVRSDSYSPDHMEAGDEAEAEGEGVLDENGTVLLRCEAPFPDGAKRGRCTVDWRVDVISAEAQTISSSTECLVQYGKALAGIHAEAKSGMDGVLVVEADAVDMEDTPVAKTPLRLDVYRMDTKTVKEKVAPFVVKYRNSTSYEKVATREVETPVEMEIPVGKPGNYVIVATGPAGVPVSTTALVTGDELAELPVLNETSLQLSLPEPFRAYVPGETAPISVQAPFGGVAWVTVEAGGIIDSFTVPLPGNAGRIDLPIKESYSPNAFVTVYLVQPGKDGALPRERAGSLRIEIKRPDHEIAIATKLDSETVKPGGSVRGECTVTSQGKPVAGAELLVFAVDEAVLKLGEWSMPDPDSAFYPPRFHMVSTYAALTDFIEKINPRSIYEKGYTIGDGGEAAVSPSAARKEFQTLAYWKSGLETDANGKLSFDFPAPDNLTSYRVVVVGMTEKNQFGAGTTLFKVSKPLLCEPALPRFVRSGDEVQLRAVVRQKVKEKGMVTVKCLVEGLDLADPKPLVATALKEIPAVYSFKAYVKSDVSAIKVRFEATSDFGESDTVEISLPVEPSSILRHESFGTVVKGASFAPESVMPENWKSGKGSFSVSLSTSPWLPKLSGLPALLEYPHGCFEQISSRYLAYAFMSDLLATLPDGAVREQRYRESIETGLKRLESGLLENGMLPYWSDSRTPNGFVTILAAWAAAEAERTGAPSSERLTGELKAALAKIISGEAIPGLYSTPFDRCFALMVGSMGPAEETWANVAEDLYSKRDHLDEEGCAMLAIAMHRLDVLPNEKAQLLKELAKPLAPRAFNPANFYSPMRSEAIITLAFAEVAPGSPQTHQRKERLLKLLDSATDLSTQENLWLLLAFKAIFDTEKPVPLATQGITPKPAAMSKNGSGGVWPGNTLANLAFRIEHLPSAVPLTALVSADYLSERADAERSDRGMRIERVVRNFTNPKRYGTAEAPFKLGDQLLITYRVFSKNLFYYVALEDLIPAGLETVNPDLPMVAKTYQLPADPSGKTLMLSHSELRDDSTCLYFDRVEPGQGTYSVLARATTAGVFCWPPTQASPMYDSRFSGVSAVSTCYVSE